jgi:hypothetical protein
MWYYDKPRMGGTIAFIFQQNENHPRSIKGGISQVFSMDEA